MKYFILISALLLSSLAQAGDLRELDHSDPRVRKSILKEKMAVFRLRGKHEVVDQTNDLLMVLAIWKNLGYNEDLQKACGATLSILSKFFPSSINEETLRDCPDDWKNDLFGDDIDAHPTLFISPQVSKSAQKTIPEKSSQRIAIVDAVLSINKKGKVKMVKVSTTDKEFKKLLKPTKRAMMKARFLPAKKTGKPVASTLNVQVQFTRVGDDVSIFICGGGEDCLK